MGYAMATQDQFDTDRSEAAEQVIKILRSTEGAALQQSDTAFSMEQDHLIVIPIQMGAIVEIPMHDIALTDNLRKLVATKVVDQLKDLRDMINEEIQAFQRSLPDPDGEPA